MTYGILLADDEPPILRYLSRLIGDSAEPFRVVGTAENGVEALRLIEELKPDIAITDIRMPLLDGLKLLAAVKERFPDTTTIIVSGYQDFEYAREGLKAGAVDYLLKPVDPKELAELLSRIKLRLDERYREKENRLLDAIVHGAGPKGVAANGLPAEGRYNLIAVRRGPLPFLHLKWEGGRPGVFPLPVERLYELERRYGLHRIALLSGRDENEFLVSLSRNAGGSIPTAEIAELLADLLFGRSGFFTVAYSVTPHGTKDLEERSAALFRLIDASVVIGKNRLICLECADESPPSPALDGVRSDTLLHYIADRDWAGLSAEIARLLGECGLRSNTQAYLENLFLQILYLVQRGVADTRFSMQSAEAHLAELIRSSTDSASLFDGFVKLVEDAVAEEDRPPVRREEHERLLFERIAKYIENNLSRPLTLQELCGKFSVSQPYLSGLFRKRGGTSCKKFVTSMRINKAIELKRQTPSLRLKDIAEIVGYDDPLHFSKVFRAVIRRSPSEYFGA